MASATNSAAGHMNPAILPAANSCFWNNARSMSGSCARCSERTNSINRIGAASAQPTNAGDAAPHAYPSLTTAMSAVSAGAIRTAPFQSKRLSAGSSLVGGSTNQPSKMPTRPTGTLIQNTQCQSSASSTRPPIAGPALNPTACAADWMPSARPRRAGPAAAITEAPQRTHRTSPNSRKLFVRSLCGLKSDISRGPRSAMSRHSAERALRNLARDRRSLRFDAGELDHLGPLLGFFANEPSKFARRGWKCRRTQFGDPSLDPGIAKRRVDLLVEFVDDFSRCVLRSAEATPSAGLVPRQKVGNGWDIR